MLDTTPGDANWMTTELIYDRIINFPIKEIIPDREVVYHSQGIDQKTKVPPKITDLYDYSLSMFKKGVEPKGIIKEISISEFSQIFQGNAENEENTPVENIFPLADYLALFAFTLGKNISETISDLFSRKDFALAYMLDSIASESADKAASIAELYFLSMLNGREKINDSSKTLLYSPGYCGWHISGQKQLFNKLEPENIGISLNNQFLMNPLKSISGVLITGGKGIHNFDNDFTFCAQCRTFSCIDR
jgi:hypothetical protein